MDTYFAELDEDKIQTFVAGMGAVAETMPATAREQEGMAATARGPETSPLEETRPPTSRTRRFVVMMMAAAWRGSEMTLEPRTTLEEATPEEATRPGIKKRLTYWRN